MSFQEQRMLRLRKKHAYGISVFSSRKWLVIIRYKIKLIISMERVLLLFSIEDTSMLTMSRHHPRQMKAEKGLFWSRLCFVSLNVSATLCETSRTHSCSVVVYTQDVFFVCFFFYHRFGTIYPLGNSEARTSGRREGYFENVIDI